MTGRANALFESEEARRLLERNGLGDIDAVFSQAPAANERHEGRCVWQRMLNSETGEPFRVFVKMHQGRRRLWPRMTDLKTGQAFQTLPEREWRGIERFRQIGLNVPERLALYGDGLWNIRAAVIVRQVPPPQSIDEMIREGRWQQLSLDERGTLLDAVLETIQAIDAAGLAWRGISSRHFYPQRASNGQWKLWLIDCEGMHNRPTATTFQRGLDKLWRSMKESGADPAILAELHQRIARRRRTT